MMTRIGSGTIAIRRVRPADAAALASMFGRCSEQTRYRRFHGPVSELPRAYLRRCIDGESPTHTTRVAELVRTTVAAESGRLVAFASAAPVPGAPAVHEAGALVEDDWQRRGIGRLLLAGLVTDARAAGAELLRFELCREQPSLLAYVLTHAQVVSARGSGCDVTVDMTIDATVDAAGHAPASGVRAGAFPSRRGRVQHR